jgi:peptidoglycan hydrolase-like protein with peptidoglycan-binding domain
MLDGGQVDVEVIVSSKLLDYIAWVPGEPSPHAPAPTPAAPAVHVTWAMWPAGVTLRYGAAGNPVRVLQMACRNSRIPGVRGITVDGDWGNQTQTAVRNFQTVKKLTVDGIAGKFTRNALAALKDV